MRVLDSHVHIFPDLGSASGYESVEMHMRYLQKDLCYSAQPIRRVKDNVAVGDQSLWNGIDPGPGGLRDVNFRVGRCGRVLWTCEDVDYYMQFQSPALQDMKAPPEFIVAQMDYVGVERVVLQNAHLYGRLNEYFGEAVRTYPDRFLALADLDEPNAHTDGEIQRLIDGVERLGLRGVYYTSGGLFTKVFRDHIDDRKFDPYWVEVERRDLVVFWDIDPYPMPTKADYLDQFRHFGRWHERFPGVRSALVHGLGSKLLKGDRYEIPSDIFDICRRPTVWLELLFPIAVGRIEEYPFPTGQERVRQLFDTFGPDKLVWGSDLPNVERCCTYQQSLDYIRLHCPFLSKDEKQMVLGGNLSRVFGL